MAVAYATMLGRQIKHLRDAAGLSQYALAASLGCSQATVSCWEHGVNLPSVRALIKMAQVLSTTVGHLVHPIDVRLVAARAPRPEAAPSPVGDAEAFATLGHHHRVLAAAAVAQGTVPSQALTMSSLACCDASGCEVYGEGPSPSPHGVGLTVG